MVILTTGECTNCYVKYPISNIHWPVVTASRIYTLYSNQVVEEKILKKEFQASYHHLSRCAEQPRPFWVVGKSVEVDGRMCLLGWV